MSWNLSDKKFYIEFEPLGITIDEDLYKGKNVREFIKKLKEDIGNIKADKLPLHRSFLRKKVYDEIIKIINKRWNKTIK